MKWRPLLRLQRSRLRTEPDGSGSSVSGAMASVSARLPRVSESHPPAAASGARMALCPVAEAERIARQGPGYPPLFRAPNFITQRIQLRDDDLKRTAGESPQAATRKTQRNPACQQRSSPANFTPIYC